MNGLVVRRSRNEIRGGVVGMVGVRDVGCGSCSVMDKGVKIPSPKATWICIALAQAWWIAAAAMEHRYWFAKFMGLFWLLAPLIVALIARKRG